jgi:hypothetical protein
MKKLTTIIFCTAFFSAVAIAQSGVRIGNLEFSVRNIGTDTLVQITVDEPCPPCPECPEIKTRTRNRAFNSGISDGFSSIGFILPDHGSGYYDVIGGSSWNFNIGSERRYHLARRFAVGGNSQYSYYNYKLRPMDETYLHKVIGLYNKDGIRKQVFRSHNLAAGVFARFYFAPPRDGKKSGGMFIDAGVQGDWVFSKYCKIKTRNEGNHKARDGYAFNPFQASATARVGWGSTVIFARYRFTDAFNQKALPMDLPPVTIGLQFF